MNNSKRKKLLLSIIYTLIVAIVGIIVFLILHTRINIMLFDYKFEVYNHEIDFLFQNIYSKQFPVRHTYKSGSRGAIYFVQYDSLTNISVIETTNFKSQYLKSADTVCVNEIEVSDLTTYSAVYVKKYPIIQQALNPRKSENLKISFEKPVQIDTVVKKHNSIYIKGKFNHVAFGNTQNSSILTFPGKSNHEILVIKRFDKLYFIFQSISNKCLLDIVNPKFLD